MIKVDTEKVAAARQASGLSIHGAAAVAKVNFKTVQCYEGRGENPPPANPAIETLAAIAKAYSINPRDLVTDPAEWDRELERLGLATASAEEALA